MLFSGFPRRRSRLMPSGRMLARLAVIGLVAASAPVAWTLVGAETREAASGVVASEGWQTLFDGTSLAGWKRTEFYGAGAVAVDKAFAGGAGAIVIEKGDFLTGINRADAVDLPTMNYEIALDAMRVEGGDFFCGLTFPVGKHACSFIVGGWGGTVVGLSSVDHSDASDNDTTTGKEFALKKWYRIRIRVTDQKIEAWIDQEQVVDLETMGRKIGLRDTEIEKSLPLGISAYQTRAAIRDIRLRKL
ncbi:3-keto-disaccharide hydrolase [Horticoccus sp. 23ND18S-11]|uniref:3-keto-disaccharide hydrolase n=1 Tax=Horticoccus sp. 23ND18S-11 TaxID=3391832 RepID=UPI0039C9BC56